MRYYEVQQREYQICTSVKCDVCGIISDDPIDIQNWMMYTRHEGYGSRYGDGDTIRIDMCPECLHKMLGPYLQLIPEEE